MPSALPSGFVPAVNGSPTALARDALDWWTVAGGSNAIQPYAQQAEYGFQSDSPAFSDYGANAGGGARPAVTGGSGGAGGYSPSNTSAQDTRAGRDATSQNTSGGLIGGPSLSSGGSGPSESGSGLNAFGDVFIGGAPRVARVAEAEESATTYRYLALAAMGMTAAGLLIFFLRK